MIYRNIYTTIMIILSLCLNFSNVNAQILNVPYLDDIVGCGNWCWAKSDQMAINYYGHSVQLCEVLEFARQRNFITDNHIYCCNNPLSCCQTAESNKNEAVLENWQVYSTYEFSSETLGLLRQNLQKNSPVIMHLANVDPITYKWTGGHTVIAYGLDSDDVYFHNPGNGSQMRDYYDLTTSFVQRWVLSNRIDISANACMLVQTVTGTKNNLNSTYKAINSIKASCIINSSSNITLLCNNEVLLEPGFEIQSGCGLSIETGIIISCP